MKFKFKAIDRFVKKERRISEIIISEAGEPIAVRFETDEDITGIKYVDLYVKILNAWYKHNTISQSA